MTSHGKSTIAENDEPVDAPAAASVFEKHGIVVQHRLMRDLLAQATQVAPSKASVLIEGESGTGKELVAKLIHFSSPRSDKPFIRVNCAALSESLVESELFGHEKGAFTGADESRPGRFELADGGTLLLDEISEMSSKLQAKLLRILEEEEFERVGGARTIKIDVRVIATSNRNLEQESRQGKFRHDLYYRLNAVQLHLPPLRARRDDIVPLADFFFSRFKHETAPEVRGLSTKAKELLTAYHWPGNIRQLRNVIHRACLLGRGPEIEPADLPPLEDACPAILSMPRTIADMERQMILTTLRELGGNKTATAQQLGVTTRTLLNKLNRYRRDAA